MLTTTGRSALLLGIIATIVGVLAGWTEVAVVGVALLVAVASALAWIRNRAPLEVRRELDPIRVTRGTPAHAVLVVRNRSSRSVPQATAEDYVGGVSRPVALPRLAADTSAEVSYPLPTQRRGVVAVGPMTLERSDPFRFVRFVQTYGDVRHLFVHPRRHPLTRLPATMLRTADGPSTDTSPRGSVVFHALREYVPGDDRRHIHWRSSARTGTLMVRQYVDTSQPDLTVLLDNRRSRHSDESFEEAVEITASLVIACSDDRFPTRLRTTDHQALDPRPGQSPSQYFLDTLAGIDLEPGGSLATVLDSLLVRGGGTTLIVVTGDPDPIEIRAVAGMSNRYRSVVLIDVNPRPDGARTVYAGLEHHVVGSAREFVARWNAGARS